SPRERGEEGFYGDLDSLPWVVQVELWAALTLVFECSAGRKTGSHFAGIALSAKMIHVKHCQSDDSREHCGGECFT
ncbi:MAG TPA: hypothetical protein VFP43_23650, partial [Mesorhizobium sp.]|nr:hypothetical protein [Mesorhizobium sp.]